jgi:REP element-mobilizing transposase RayT
MEPQQLPVRRTDVLHRGRISGAGELYFITLVTKDREPWLALVRGRDVFLAVLRGWHGGRNGRVLAATVMPDHAHILIELGDRLTVGQVVAGWKSTTRKGAGYAETFQRDFWEHRLRSTEDLEDYGLYIFLNHFRARLLHSDEQWEGWWLPDPSLFRFPVALDPRGCPPKEWIDWPDTKFAGVAHGD